MGLLIDSTVLIHAEREAQTPEDMVRELLDRFGDIELAISVMTAAELFHGCWRADTPARKARRTDFVESVLSAIPAIPISLPIARLFGQLDASLRQSGETIPTSDLLIASTALARDDEMVTDNDRHFRRIPGLVVHRYPSEHRGGRSVGSAGKRR